MQKIIKLAVFILISAISLPSFAETNLQFQSGEHIYIGNSAHLYFPVKKGSTYVYQNLTGAQADFRPLLGLKTANLLSYGKIAASPDYFSNPNVIISNGKSLTERQTYFNLCFNAFLQTKLTTLNNVYAIMNEEVNLIATALKNKIQPSIAYKQKVNYFINKYYNADPLMLQIALVNFDHFGNDAWLAYQAGHAQAINTAYLAFKEKTPEKKAKQLVTAYAKEAFADHFLSDNFAAGHMRVPRRELAAISASESSNGAIGNLLAAFMHDEDNGFALYPTNLNHDTWIAYGDNYYLDVVDQKNRQLMEITLQQSIDEVIKAFQQGVITPDTKYAAKKMIPNINALKNYLTYVNSRSKTIPLFVYDANLNNLLRRKDINMLHPKKLPITINNMKRHSGLSGWWASTTLYELQNNYHPTVNTKINYELATITEKDGQLNAKGWYLLAKSLTKYQRALFCADKTTSKLMRNYLQCGVKNNEP